MQRNAGQAMPEKTEILLRMAGKNLLVKLPKGWLPSDYEKSRHMTAIVPHFASFFKLQCFDIPSGVSSWRECITC